MIKTTSKEIRQLWIDFFEKKGHLKIESHSLVPDDDKSILWINSGVAGIKDYFSGRKKPPRKELVNYQKSIRTNDVENVGKTSRHHTFFEMLGNFSIGGYFKDKAIEYGYEFLVDVLKIDVNKLYFTCYIEDQDAKEKWLSLGIKKSHIFLNGKKENFWDLGSGPCGPDTEIFYDRGPKYDPENKGIELLKNDIENDRYIEIWNIVFSQFNNDGNGNYTDLSQKNIDTGAGLERLTAISQNCHTNFESDLFLPIIKKIESFSTYKYDPENYFVKNKATYRHNLAFKIIADHMRAICMSINDNVVPSNISRGYIIRMLIRRALRQGIQIGINEPFLFKLCNIVLKTLPIYSFDPKAIATIIKLEEERFIKTLKKGEILLNQSLKNTKVLDSKTAFKLFDTYGFPIEMTKEIAAEKNIKVDMNEFYKLKEAHSKVSRSNKKNIGLKKQINSMQILKSKISKFVGYDTLKTKAKILYLFDEEKELLKNDGLTYLITNVTPFYATSGGQKFDKGYIIQNSIKHKVLNVFKDKNQNHVHLIDGKINKNDEVDMIVNKEKRLGAARNHSATHLTFAALSIVYDNQLPQLGSSLDHEKLHLDVKTKKMPSPEIIKKIEAQMHKWIKANITPRIDYLAPDEVKSRGVLTLESQDYKRYGTSLRAVYYGDWSYELCGGTHVANTKELENYVITSIVSKQSGIYRLFAVTGNKLVNKFLKEKKAKHEDILFKLISKIQEFDPKYSIAYKDTIDSIQNAYVQAQTDYKRLRKESLKNKKVDLSSLKEITINNQEFAILFNFSDMSSIKTATNKLRSDYPDKIIIISVVKNNKTFVSVGSKNITSKKVFNAIITKFVGKGGGNDFVSQGMMQKTFKYNELIEVLENA